METTKYTFWNLLNEYSIEIPIIQRDYAQGRYSQKINEIRKNLLDNLYSAINNNKNLDFDFIYGNVVGNKFIPLDGQQRLTTLFLLHWYLALKEGELNDFKDVLIKFSYETRTSSREFCNDLVTQKITWNTNDSLSEAIKNSSWFFLSWEKDLTIKSMLVMLDDIHARFH